MSVPSLEARSSRAASEAPVTQDANERHWGGNNNECSLTWIPRSVAPSAGQGLSLGGRQDALPERTRSG